MAEKYYSISPYAWSMNNPVNRIDPDGMDDYKINSDLALKTAHYCFLDTIGCGFEALTYPACTKLLGPIVPGTYVPNGAKVPGTSFQLDPIQAAFNIGAMVRWLDFIVAFLLVYPIVHFCFSG